MDGTEKIVLVVIGLIALFLITRRWFCLIVFGVGGLASASATLASIFHFQILGALDFFFLTDICRFIESLIAVAY